MTNAVVKAANTARMIRDYTEETKELVTKDTKEGKI